MDHRERANNILNCPHGEIPCEVNVHMRDFLQGVNKFQRDVVGVSQVSAMMYKIVFKVHLHMGLLSINKSG